MYLIFLRMCTNSYNVLLWSECFLSGPSSKGFDMVISTSDPDLGENGTNSFTLINDYGGLFNITTLPNNTVSKRLVSVQYDISVWNKWTRKPEILKQW